jgi:hypothetical protein
MQDSNSIEIFIPKVTNPLIIDIDDLDIWNSCKWYYNKRDKRMFSSNGVQTSSLERCILSKITSDRYETVDHINCNSMDNRKINLRGCTYAQNLMNRTKRINCSSKYKGVYYRKDRQKFSAEIKVNFKKLALGCYNTQEEAALAYNLAAKRLFGEYAKLNNIY